MSLDTAAWPLEVVKLHFRTDGSAYAASFSDGRYYHFTIRDGEITFHGERGSGGDYFAFRSPKRAAEVKRAIAKRAPEAVT